MRGNRRLFYAAIMLMFGSTGLAILSGIRDGDTIAIVFGSIGPLAGILLLTQVKWQWPNLGSTGDSAESSCRMTSPTPLAAVRPPDPAAAGRGAR